MNKRRFPHTTGLRATMFLLLTVFTITAFAQYNKVFYNALGPNGRPMGEAGRDIVDAGNGHTCVLASTGGVFSLKELDMSGTVVCEETFLVSFMPNPPFEQYYVAEQLIKAANGDYLVAGHIIANGPTFAYHINPFVGRFRKDPGNPAKFIGVWLYEYPSNNDPSFANRPFAWRTSIVLAEDDAQEAYIIAAPADDSYTPVAGSGTTTVQAFKITANGILVWNKKYYDQGATALSRNLYVTTLAYGAIIEGVPPLEKYFIGGNNDESISFDMTIDGNGNIIDQYREYDFPGDEYYFQSVLFDAGTEEFVLSNTMSSTSAGNSMTQITVSKIDFSTMAISPTDYYYENDPGSTNCSSFAHVIVEDLTQNYYLIGGSTKKDNNGTGVLYSGPSILKIDKSGNVQFFKRYNRLGNTSLQSMTTTIDVGGIENYAVCGGISLMPGDNTRVFTTDVSGATCGEESLAYGQGILNLSPVSYTFADVNITGQVHETPTTYSNYQVRDCDPGNPEYKPGRPTSVPATMDNDFGMDAYPNPTLDRLTVQLRGSMGANATLTVIDVTGRIVYHTPVENNKIVVDAIKLPAGVYLVQYTSDSHRGQVKFVKQ